LEVQLVGHPLVVRVEKGHERRAGLADAVVARRLLRAEAASTGFASILLRSAGDVVAGTVVNLDHLVCGPYGGEASRYRGARWSHGCTSV
jgi:hypothetical protein